MLTPESLDRLEALALAQQGKAIGTGVLVTPYELLVLVHHARHPLFIVDPVTQDIDIVLDQPTARSDADGKNT